MLKKRILGAAVLLLLLAVILPQFLTGEGDVLSLRKSRLVPQPPEQVSSHLTERLLPDQEAQPEQSIAEQPVAGDDGLISRQIPAPQPDDSSDSDLVTVDLSAQQDQTDSTQNDGGASAEAVETNTEEVAEVTEPEEQPKQKKAEENKLSKNEVDLIGQLARKKSSRWAVQVGAFSDPDNARSVADQIRKNSSQYPVFIQQRNINGADLQVVFVGPILSESAAVERKQDISRQFKVKAIAKPYSELGIE